MAGYYQKGHLGGHLGGQLPQVSGVSLVCASVAALAIGGPMLGMMGFSFLASTTLLLVCSPLLLLFSPLLLPVAFLFMATLAGFAVAHAMALTGLHRLGRIARETIVRFGGLRPHYWTTNFESTTSLGLNKCTW